MSDTQSSCPIGARIESYEAYSELVRRYQLAAKQPLTNCTLLRPAAERIIKDEGLYALPGEGALTVLRPHVGSYHCYYFADAAAPLAGMGLRPLDAPVIAYELTNDRALVAPAREALLTHNGFRLFQTTEYLYQTVTPLPAEDRPPVPPEGIVIRCAQESDADAIFALMRKNFDPRVMQIITRPELAEVLREGNSFVAAEDGRTVGFVVRLLRGALEYNRWLAVAADKQGKGLGRALHTLADYHARLEGRTRVGGWVDIHDTPWFNSILKSGHVSDRRRLYSFVLE